MNRDAAYWIDHLSLSAHPEGGYFKETYRSEEWVELPRFSGRRPVSTAILYLLPQGSVSQWHRIKSDEIWHFHAGEDLRLDVIMRDGLHSVLRIGPEGPFQAVVPHGSWFSAIPEGAFALVGCTVAPGFDFADFEMARIEELVERFPHLSQVIRATSFD
ncbi:MAG: cupin domain-containing protein [Acidobacteria bacterium]|nr:cupin domain-containing protein [Acidobacteriota bacterium]